MFSRPHPFRSPRLDSQKGGALLAVLWLSAALAAIGFAVSTRVLAETDHVAASADGLRAQYLASGSVERAIQWMGWGPGRPNSDGAGQFWRRNTPRLYMSYPSGDVVVEMIPESSKMNINSAPVDQLQRVIAAVSGDAALARQIAVGIAAYRGGSTALENPPTGGNSGVNLPQGPTFAGPRASFREIEELLSVPGMTPELFYGNYIADDQGVLYATGGLRDSLSVWGSAGPYEINTVSPAVMQAIGVPAGTVQEILRRRSIAPIGSLAEVGGLGGGASRLTTTGLTMWTIRATARLRDGNGLPSDVVRTASATVKHFLDPLHAPNPVHVLRFQNDAWSEFAIAPPAVPGGPTVGGGVR